MDDMDCMDPPPPFNPHRRKLNSPKTLSRLWWGGGAAAFGAGGWVTPETVKRETGKTLILIFIMLYA